MFYNKKFPVALALAKEYRDIGAHFKILLSLVKVMIIVLVIDVFRARANITFSTNYMQNKCYCSTQAPATTFYVFSLDQAEEDCKLEAHMDTYLYSAVH